MSWTPGHVKNPYYIAAKLIQQLLQSQASLPSTWSSQFHVEISLYIYIRTPTIS
jgi:hypothetical protein